MVDATKMTTPGAYVVTIPRGGWFGGRKSASTRYRESLEEKLLHLGRQLRQARDEVGQLRDRQKHGSRPIVINNGDDIMSADEKLELEEEITALTNKINDLENTKAAMDDTIQEFSAKVLSLGKQLAKEQESNEELRERYEEELSESQSTMNTSAEKKVSDVENDMEERVTRAAESARIEVENEFSAKIEKLKEQLESSYQEALEAEKMRGSEAVDVEKKKMRKLVKALAIREKKLADQ
jgi:chromosome segregation ATPase